MFVITENRIVQKGRFGYCLRYTRVSIMRSFEPFIQLMQSMSNPLLGILVAAAFTALVQSSSATTGIGIVLATQGFITLEAGIALAFGAKSPRAPRTSPGQRDLQPRHHARSPTPIPFLISPIR